MPSVTDAIQGLILGRDAESPQAQGVASALGPAAMSTALLASGPAYGARTALSTLLSPTSTQSAEADEVDPRLGEINQLSTRIGRNQSEIERLGSTRTKSPAGTQMATIKTLQDSIGSDRSRLQYLQDTLNSEQSAKHEAEKPFRESFPTAYRALPLLGWGASALGGMLGAKGGAPIYSALKGAVGGSLGSTAAAVGPTAYDAATLPVGSHYQKEAADWLRSPEYWYGRVAPEIGEGAIIGALTGKLSSDVRKPRSQVPPKAAPSATPATPKALNFWQP